MCVLCVLIHTHVSATPEIISVFVAAPFLQARCGIFALAGDVVVYADLQFSLGIEMLS